MKNLCIILLCVFMISSCKQLNQETNKTTNTKNSTTQSTTSSSVKTCNKEDICFLQKPEKIKKLGLLLDNDESRYYKESDSSTTYYRIGAFMLGKQKGELYLVSSRYVYMNSKLYFAKLGKKYYFIESISTDFGGHEVYDSEEIFSTKVEKEGHEQLTKLIKQQFPLEKSISFTKNKKSYTLKLERNTIVPFVEKNFEKIPGIDGNFYIETRKPHKWGSDFYKKYNTLKNTDYKAFEKLEQSIQDKYLKESEEVRTLTTKGIYKKLADGTTAIYSFAIPFVGENEDGGQKLDIKVKNREKGVWYHSSDTSGCGMGAYAFDLQGSFTVSILNPKTDTDPKADRFTDMTFSYTNDDLVVIGKTNDGENIYGFGDNNHPFLQGLYKGYQASIYMNGGGTDINGEKIKVLDYKTFVNGLPIFFWDDPFGRRLALIKQNTVMDLEMACGAKPVIYLYPEQKQNITVHLDWKKRELISIPKYKNAWNVQADVKGNISYQGKNYPYLFWEDSLIYKKKTDGFVIAKENIPIFLDEKLSILGLNEKEKTDFTEFWLEKLKEKPYYFIRFYGNETMDKIAPITIIPKPDSIQRIFMDYQGLDEQVQVIEQQLSPFTRTGFSVIEWGGNLQK